MSTEIFEPKDLLESLVRLEQNGHSFYIEASKRFDDLEIKEFFKFLADQELHHEKLYKELAEKSEISTSNLSRKEYDEEYKLYLQSLVDASFDFDFNFDDSDVKDVYNFAIGLEKDTIIFIGELRKILPDFEREIFDKVEAEERKHIKLINDWYKRFINN